MRLKLLKLLLFVVLLVAGFQIRSSAEDIKTEVLSLKLENNILLVEVARKYPEIRFSKFQNPNKVLIELLDSKYHDKFKFDEVIKKTILDNAHFISDLTVGEAKYDDSKTKVSVILTLKEDFTPYTRIISTKENIVRISFEQQANQNIQAVKPEEPQLDKNLEIIRELYNNAVGENLNGNLEKAEALYKEIISKDANFYPARYNLSKLYFDKGNYAQSQELISSLITDIENKSEEIPDKRILLLSESLLGQVYLREENYSKAYEQFNKVINIDPLSYEAHFNLGIVNEKIQDVKESLLNFKKVIELNPDYAPAYYHLGVLNSILKNKEEAIFNLERVISLLPESDLGRLSEEELKKLGRKKSTKSK